MRTATLLDTMNKVFRRRGLDPTAVTETQKGLVVDFINERLKIAWEFTYWREWTYLEERAYRPMWYVDATYGLAAEVWNGSDKYYQSVQAGNIGHALTDLAWWTDITGTMEKYILLDQSGKTRIGATKNIYRSKADAERNIRELTYYLDTDRIHIYDPNAGATVWVVIREEAPRLVYEVWSGTATYAEGWVVYFPTANPSQQQGQCYRASLTEQNIQYWELMEIPLDLQRYCVLGATADYLRHDAQQQRAEMLEAQAEDEMFCTYTSAQNQNGIFTTCRVVTAV